VYNRTYPFKGGRILSLLNKPIQIGGIQLKNRIVMAPMQQRMGTHEAFVTDHHINHYGERAKGGRWLSHY
jgi:2,4-dienoyl-CoA reductase-like NADH-dependent reductase (Old Yellow Enzyme family)